MKLPEHDRLSYDTDLSDIPAGVLKGLYVTMLRIQRIELKIAELYHEDEMKTPVHLCLGQEAVSAGVCAHLKPEDYVFTNHRGHGHYIAKGGDIRALVAELYGRTTGTSKGRGGSMHLVDMEAGLPGSSSIVGGGVPIATGAALGSSIRGDGRVTAVFFGDAATEEGAVYESLNFAVLKALPIVYVCENNFYSVYSPLENRESGGEIYRKFEGLGLPCYQVDGNNVIDVYRTARRAVADARDGKGPSFLECRTYRLRDHHGTGSGVEIGYRAQEEVDAWAGYCPVDGARGLLLTRGILSEEEIDKISDGIDTEVAEAFAFAQGSPLPGEDDLLDYLFQ